MLLLCHGEDTMIGDRRGISFYSPKLTLINEANSTSEIRARRGSDTLQIDLHHILVVFGMVDGEIEHFAYGNFAE